MYSLDYIEKNKEELLLHRKKVVLNDLKFYLKLEYLYHCKLKRDNIKKIREIKKLLKYFKYKNTCIECFIKLD